LAGAVPIVQAVQPRSFDFASSRSERALRSMPNGGSRFNIQKFKVSKQKTVPDVQNVQTSALSLIEGFNRYAQFETFKCKDLEMTNGHAHASRARSYHGFRNSQNVKMKLLGAELRRIFAKFSEALPPSFATAKEVSPRLHPRSKLRGIRRRRMKSSPLNLN
jgi:hypothetical protein